jgi:hypothetical protein
MIDVKELEAAYLAFPDYLGVHHETRRPVLLRALGSAGVASHRMTRVWQLPPLIVCNVSDADGCPGIADGGEGVSDGVESGAFHETAECVRVVDSLDRKQADGAAMRVAPGAMIEAESSTASDERGGGDKLATT